MCWNMKKQNIWRKNREITENFGLFFLKFVFREKIAKNMTFSKKIWIFSMFLDIPEVQIPPKTTFLTLWQSFLTSKSAKNA